MMILAESVTDSAGFPMWLQLVTQGGALVLLAGILWFMARVLLPQLLAYVERKDQAHVSEIRTIRQEQKEERDKFVGALDRNTAAIDALRDEIGRRGT